LKWQRDLGNAPIHALTLVLGIGSVFRAEIFTVSGSPQDTSSLKISARLKAISAKLNDRDQTYVLRWGWGLNSK